MNEVPEIVLYRGEFRNDEAFEEEKNKIIKAVGVLKQKKLITFTDIKEEWERVNDKFCIKLENLEPNVSLIKQKNQEIEKEYSKYEKNIKQSIETMKNFKSKSKQNNSNNFQNVAQNNELQVEELDIEDKKNPAAGTSIQYQREEYRGSFVMDVKFPSCQLKISADNIQEIGKNFSIQYFDKNGKLSEVFQVPCDSLQGYIGLSQADIGLNDYYTNKRSKETFHNIFAKGFKSTLWACCVCGVPVEVFNRKIKEALQKNIQTKEKFQNFLENQCPGKRTEYSYKPFSGKCVQNALYQHLDKDSKSKSGQISTDTQIKSKKYLDQVYIPTCSGYKIKEKPELTQSGQNFFTNILQGAEFQKGIANKK